MAMAMAKSSAVAVVPNQLIADTPVRLPGTLAIDRCQGRG